MHDAATRLRYPFLDLLEAHVDAIRAEALALSPADFVPMAGYQRDCHGFPLFAGPWAGGFPGVDFADHQARCPRTVAVAAQIPGLFLCGFLRLGPGGAMGVHTDPREDHTVRCHLGLRLTTEEQAWWPEGAARLMDTRTAHWARNDEAYARLTLVIDVTMPFVVPTGAFGRWRPDRPDRVPRRGEGVDRGQRKPGDTGLVSPELPAEAFE